MAITTLSSPITTASNKIVAIGRKSQISYGRTKSAYTQFANFLDFKQGEIRKFKIPKSKEIKRLGEINVTNTFGSVGGLLDGILTSSFNPKELVSNFVSNKGNKSGLKAQSKITGAKSVLRGGRLKIGGFKSIGVANALFAGMDFATGLQEGETVGKAAAGASGSLAGSLLGGVIGQSLIPIPGVGFIVGSTVGGFLGGWGADRDYGAISGAKSFQEEKLKEDNKPQNYSKVQNKDSVERLNSLVSDFETPVNEFETFVNDVVSGKIVLASSQRAAPPPQNPNTTPEDFNYDGDGELVQYLHGDPNRPGYDPGHAGSRAHDHFSFSSRSAALAAYYALKDAGYQPYEFEGVDGGVTLPSAGRGHSMTGGHYGPVGQTGTLDNKNDGTAFDIPWSTYGSGPIGEKDYQKSRRAYEIVMAALKSRRGSSGSLGAGPNIFNLELHHPGAGEETRSGLIENRLISGNEVTSAFKREFGSYERNFRGGLGTPNRGGNILEMQNELGVENNAQRIIEIIKKYPNYQFNIFPGHTDVASGTGGEGAPGEQEFVTKVTNRIEALSRKLKLTNVRFYRATAKVSGEDPRSFWSIEERLWQESLRSRQNSRVNPAPRPSTNGMNLRSSAQSNYTTTIASIPSQDVIMMNPGGNSPIIPIPISSQNQTASVYVDPYKIALSKVNQISTSRLAFA